MIFLGDFSFVRIFLKNYRVTMTTTLDTSCSENTMVLLVLLVCAQTVPSPPPRGGAGCSLRADYGFVSKARVSACMYFLVLLHNHKWLKKISKKVSSSFETVQCILSSILCPSIFRQIAAILMARRFSAR